MINEQRRREMENELRSVEEREASVARREADVARREQELVRMGSTWSESHQNRLSRDEMLRRGTDSPLYNPSTGSYYSESLDRPIGDAAPQSSFGEGTSRVTRGPRERPMYPAGTGSYYSESFERPTGDAAPEAYFGEGTSTTGVRAIREEEAAIKAAYAAGVAAGAEAARRGALIKKR